MPFDISIYIYIHIYIYFYNLREHKIKCELEWLVKFGGLIILGSGLPSLSLT